MAKRIYLNDKTYFLKPSASVTESAEIPEPTEVITLQEDVTLYRDYISGEDDQGAFIQERE